MKNVLFLLLLCAVMVSCKSSRLKSEAQKQMELTLTEVAKDPSSMKLSNVEVVYSDDSLCIIHFDYSGKNGFGNEITSKMEYVMLNHADKNYEAFQQLSTNDETVYMTKEDFEKNKKGQIYEKLSYESTLYYLAAVFVNTQGREAGVKDGEAFNIPVPTETGSWEIGSIMDEFGEKTNKKFLLLQGSGVFSNSATTNSRLLGALYVMGNDDDVSLLLAEYGTSVVKTSDSYDVHVKDGKGQVYDVTMQGDPDTGRLYPSYYDEATMNHLLNSNGIVTFSIRQRNSYGTSSTYIFKVDVTGFAKAKEYCKDLELQALANDPYFVANRKFVEDASKNPSYKKVGGVYCKILKKGNGVVPKDDSMVKVHYEGHTIDGKVFDSSYQRGEAVVLRANQVIKGWTEALTHMPVGSVWEVVIPSDLAYGEREQGQIKPYSTLIFKIELLECHQGW